MPPPQGGAEEVTSSHSCGPGGLGMSRTLGWALLGPGSWGTEKVTSNTVFHQLG